MRWLSLIDSSFSIVCWFCTLLWISSSLIFPASSSYVFSVFRSSIIVPFKWIVSAAWFTFALVTASWISDNLVVWSSLIWVFSVPCTTSSSLDFSINARFNELFSSCERWDLRHARDAAAGGEKGFVLVLALSFGLWWLEQLLGRAVLLA